MEGTYFNNDNEKYKFLVFVEDIKEIDYNLASGEFSTYQKLEDDDFALKALNESSRNGLTIVNTETSAWMSIFD